MKAISKIRPFWLFSLVLHLFGITVLLSLPSLKQKPESSLKQEVKEDFTEVRFISSEPQKEMAEIEREAIASELRTPETSTGVKESSQGSFFALKTTSNTTSGLRDNVASAPPKNVLRDIAGSRESGPGVLPSVKLSTSRYQNLQMPSGILQKGGSPPIVGGVRGGGQGIGSAGTSPSLLPSPSGRGAGGEEETGAKRGVPVLKNRDGGLSGDGGGVGQAKNPKTGSFTPREKSGGGARGISSIVSIRSGAGADEVLSDVSQSIVLGDDIVSLPKDEPGGIIVGRGKDVKGRLHLVRLDDPLHPSCYG